MTTPTKTRSTKKEAAKDPVEVDAFKAKARAEVMRQRRDNGWCESGTSRILQDLDMAPMKTKYTATVSIRGSVSAVEGATTYDEAKARVTAAFALACADEGIKFTGEIVRSDVYESYVE